MPATPELTTLSSSDWRGLVVGDEEKRRACHEIGVIVVSGGRNRIDEASFPLSCSLTAGREHG
jgi:hypothetical protein